MARVGYSGEAPNPAMPMPAIASAGLPGAHSSRNPTPIITTLGSTLRGAGRTLTTNRPPAMPTPHAAAPAAAAAVDNPSSSCRNVAAKYEKQNSTTMHVVSTTHSRHHVDIAGTDRHALVPIRIVEHAQIRRLVEGGTIVIAAGGGGCPVYIDPKLGMEGLDAVVDKDRAAQVLAADIDASEFVILTDVDGVYRNFGTPAQELVAAMTAAEARRMIEAGELGKGSMAPKVEACVAFVEGGGVAAHIGRLDQGLDVVEGKTGTTIRP